MIQCNKPIFERIEQMICPFKSLIDSAYANELARAKGAQTGSTDIVLAEERSKKFMARRDTIDLTIPFLQYMFYHTQDGKCPVSNIVLDINDKLIKDKNDWRWILAPSLDRMDNDLGYTQENVQIVCRFVNVGFKDFAGDRQIVTDILFNGLVRPAVGVESFMV